ncbi:MAG: hypothetical protein E4G89_06215 [Methanothrix sp.]|nr:MAG: hypothetical protein E4G89_06215 [Methanothrix sp.]
MISEITVKVTLGPPAALAESSGGYARVEAIPNPPDAFESSAINFYVPPVPDVVEESRGRFAEIPAPELEETGSESREIVPPQEFQSAFEEKASSSSINKVRIIGEIAPPE